MFSKVVLLGATLLAGRWRFTKVVLLSATLFTTTKEIDEV